MPGHAQDQGGGTYRGTHHCQARVKHNSRNGTRPLSPLSARQRSLVSVGLTGSRGAVTPALDRATVPQAHQGLMTSAEGYKNCPEELIRDKLRITTSIDS